MVILAVPSDPLPIRPRIPGSKDLYLDDLRSRAHFEHAHMRASPPLGHSASMPDISSHERWLRSSPTLSLMAGPPKVERTRKIGKHEWRKVRNTVLLTSLARPSKLRDSAPESMAGVADEFEHQHRILSARMKRAQHILRDKPGSSAETSGAYGALVRACNDVKRERFPAVPMQSDQLNDGSRIRADVQHDMKWTPYRVPAIGGERSPSPPMMLSLKNGPLYIRPDKFVPPPAAKAGAGGAGAGGQVAAAADTDRSPGRRGRRGALKMGGSRSGGPPRRPTLGALPVPPSRDHGDGGGAHGPESGEPVVLSNIGPEPGMPLGDGTVAILPKLASSGSSSKQPSGDQGGQKGSDHGSQGGTGKDGGDGGGSANGGQGGRMVGRDRGGGGGGGGGGSGGGGAGGRGGGGGADGSGGGGSSGGVGAAGNNSAQKRASSGDSGRTSDSPSGGRGNGLAEGGGDGRSSGAEGEVGGAVSPGSPFPDFSDFDDDDDPFVAPDEPDFDLMSSIWAPRAKWSDGKALFDTPSIETTRFENDWKLVQAIGATKEVMRHNQADDEVQQVGEVLHAHHQTLHLIFAYYASYSDELHYLTLNAWTQLTEDFRFAKASSKFCKKSDLDRLFISIDTMSIMMEKEQLRAMKAASGSSSNVFLSAELQDRQKALSRIEFMGALVHLAIFKYVKTGEVARVSDALERLIGIDMVSRVHPRVIALPDRFRRRYAYTQDVVFVLEWYEDSLRNIFDCLCALGYGPGATLMNLKSWRDGIVAMNLLSADLGERDVTLCFSWSRMCVGDSKTLGGLKRDSNLPFEGFLEAICRMAMMKALPTDEEILAAECEDAAVYLARLELSDTIAYEQLLQRKTPWGADQKRQPPDRCVAHLIAIMLRAIKVDKSQDDGSEVELYVTPSDVLRWRKSNWSENK